MGKHDKKKAKTKDKGKHAPEVETKSKNKAKDAKPAKASKHLEHLAKVEEAAKIVADKTRPKKERKAAARFLDEARAATKDREAAKADAAADALADAGRVVSSNPDDIDRDDEEAVRAYNATHGKASGHLISSNAEVERHRARLRADAKPSVDDTDEERKARIEAKRAKREAEQAVKTAEVMDAVDARIAKTRKAKAKEQVTEEVETERGREFVTGETTTEDTPEILAAVEDENPDFALNGIGQYKVWNPEARKERGYTRTTTYIDCLEDKSRLTDWKTREVLIGAGLDYAAITAEDGSGDLDDAILTKATRLYEEWAKAYRKAAKREAKGELDLGQFGLIRGAADKALRDGVNVLTERALEFAGANEKREHGTDLHKLTERLDRGEFDLSDESVARLVDAGTCSHADIADLKAYDAKMRELGIEHVYIEQRVVLDELKVAGTLDRGSYYKFPGASRRTKVVADLKTGRVDYSAGKIAMQLGIYSQGKGYDHKNPEERTNLGLSQSKALLIHLPAGEAKCEVYVVDLELAKRGLKLAAEVRDWRNAGKKAYDLKAPLTAATAE